MSATRYGVSPWAHRVPATRRTSFPTFTGQEEAPLVIVGGGLAGVMTAYACAAAGVKPLLLEADRLGSGGSGLGPGVCAAEATPSFRAFEQAAGRRAARAHFEQTRRAVLDLSSTVRRLASARAVRVAEAWRVVPAGQPVKAAQAEGASRRAADLKGAWHGAAAASTATGIDAAGGWRMPDWAVVDPLQILAIFATAARARGARLFERSPVTRITFDRHAATVITSRGRIVTPCVVHCTGEPTALAAGLKRHFRAASRALVMSDVLPAAVRREIGPRTGPLTDAEEPPHLVSWTADHRVVVAGADGPRPTAAQRERFHIQRTGQLMYELSRLYPAISGVSPAYGWSMPISAAADGGVCAGPHRNYPHQLFGLGTNHDPARALLVGRILARHVAGEATREDDAFGFARGR